MTSKSTLASLLVKQLAAKPQHQPFYTFRNGVWAPVSNHTFTLPTSKHEALRDLRVITWNIDFMAPEPRARMSSALEYLESLVEAIPRSTPVAIFLQEMQDSDTEVERIANDLHQLKNAPWVQQRFNITDSDTSGWSDRYGQTMLVDRRLVISSVSRLSFISEYRREALLVDIDMGSEESQFLRLCNVHLDSLTGSLRPVQWKALGNLIPKAEDNIEASIVAGDFNATQPRDQTEAQENGFKDAYLELGGIEGDTEGATWGFQSLDAKNWGTSRMDRQVYCGKIRVRALERIGVGVKVQDEQARWRLEKQGALDFVTDHYGLIGDYVFDEDSRPSADRFD
jgi:tyrosyl-DNA phosphodiesterase 2